jgi:hypothetical protein
MTHFTLLNPYREETLLEAMLGDDGRFIGLRDELEELLARVTQERPAAVSLVGPRGLGKSFMLRFLAHPRGARRLFREAVGPRFADDLGRLLFVPLDLNDEPAGAPTPPLVPRMYTALLAGLGQLLGVGDARLLPLERVPPARAASVEALGSQARRALALAREESDDEELRERFAAAVGEQLPGALIELLRRVDSWGLRAVFLLDEFDAVARRLSREEYDHLRALLATASMVIASSRALSEQVPAAVQTSPFFNLLQRLTLLSLHFLSQEDARRLVAEPPSWFPEVAFRFSEADVDYILRLTGLHPDLIRETCEYLYRTRHRSYVPGRDALPEAERPFVRALLQPLFADFFAGLWRQVGEPERHALARIATGGEGDVPPDLVTRGYVVFEDGRRRLFSGLFQEYVLAVEGARPAVVEAPRRPLSPTAGLTELERRLLELLERRPGEVVRREAIIAALYDDATDPQEARGRLDALVFRLRGKLEGEPLLIESVRGQGYRLIRRAE